MTKSGWCRSNYHSDGKRRWSNLTNGLCSECYFSSEVGTVVNIGSKVTRIQQKINDLEYERDRLNSEIDCLKYKLRTLVKPELIEL